jgi:alkanesulfonate monooxygenase SsuD/methylene tetrahydromethanopterin reductase-like flavin-dependent oxidoreductase (luciferase family)
MQLRIFTEPQQGANYADLLATAQLTEELGFDAFFRSDHYLKMGGVTGLPGPTDAWITLAGIARETTRVRLGTLVTSATFRLPGPLAIAVANVDDMSGGRVELGIGTGWYEGEHQAQGIPFGASFGERFERLVEQIEIITGLWTTDEGQTYSFQALHADGVTGAAEAGAEASAADHSRRLRPEAYAQAGREVRRRVQSAVPAAEPDRGPRRGGARGV